MFPDYSNNPESVSKFGHQNIFDSIVAAIFVNISEDYFIFDFAEYF